MILRKNNIKWNNWFQFNQQTKINKLNKKRFYQLFYSMSIYFFLCCIHSAEEGNVRLGMQSRVIFAKHETNRRLLNGLLSMNWYSTLSYATHVLQIAFDHCTSIFVSRKKLICVHNYNQQSKITAMKNIFLQFNFFYCHVFSHWHKHDF